MTNSLLLILECESGEADLAAPRKCSLVERMRDSAGQEGWLVEVTPPFIGQHFGLGPTDIDMVILLPKSVGVELADVARGRVSVYVCRSLYDGTADFRVLAHDRVELMLWGELRQAGIEAPK